jgi:hypothetical protein
MPKKQNDIEKKPVRKLEYYMFRVLSHCDTYKEVITITRKVYDRAYRTRYVRRDTTPSRMSLAKMCDGKEYSEYGGAIIIVEYCDDKIVRHAISICSQSDKFNLDTGIRIALDRLNSVESPDNPQLPKSVQDLVDSFLRGNKKYQPFRTEVYN